MNKHAIIRPTPEWLRSKYVDEQLSTKAVAVLAGVSRPTMRKWLDQDQIPRRASNRAEPGQTLLCPHCLEYFEVLYKTQIHHIQNDWCLAQVEALMRAKSHEKRRQATPPRPPLKPPKPVLLDCPLRAARVIARRYYKIAWDRYPQDAAQEVCLALLMIGVTDLEAPQVVNLRALGLSIAARMRMLMRTNGYSLNCRTSMFEDHEMELKEIPDKGKWYRLWRAA